MSDLFEFGQRIDRYAVMGNPIAHSKSPRIHSLFARQTGQHIEYSAIQVDLGGFKQAVGNFKAGGGKGLNVTVPFKQEAWALVDRRSERAERAGAVNTIKFEQDHLFGDNTDGVGLVNDLLNNNGVGINGKRLLLMGAGGAARGVIAPLLQQRPSEIVIGNRTVDKAVELAAAFSDLGAISGCGYPALQETFDVIVNATAASLAGDLPPVPPSSITAETFCYDMMYGAEPTVFMNWAKQNGAANVSDGLGMLVEQAAESFYIWRDVRPETKAVVDTLRLEMS